MRILHTADWHVGRKLRGCSRAAEHEAVLSEIVEITRTRGVDLVLIAGDLFDAAVPSPDAEALVYRVLLELADTGAQVVVVAGNHDNPRRLQSVTPLFQRAARVHIGTRVRKHNEGGVITLETPGGERARIALLPFLSQQRIVRAADLMSKDGHEHAETYAGKCAEILDSLSQGFASGDINLLVAHFTIRGAQRGAGERDAHTSSDYSVPATALGRLPIHYAALGHIHKAQPVPAAFPVWYCGSPIQLDFGDSQESKCVLLAEVTANHPARVERVALQSGRRLRTIVGSLADIERHAGQDCNAFLRVDLTEAPRPGLAQEVRELLPNTVSVRILEAAEGLPTVPPEPRQGAPRELFGEFLRDRGKDDKRLLKLFDHLLEEAYAAQTS